MSIDLEAIKKKLAKLDGNAKKTSNVQLWKPEIGEYRVRLLPWPDAKGGEPFKELWFYYTPQTILSPHQFGKPDPIRNLITELYNSGKKEDKDIAKQLKAKMRAYAPLIVKKVNGVDSNDDTVYVWGFGKIVYQRLLGFFLDDEIDCNFLDVNEGLDLKVTIKKIEGKKYFETIVDPTRKSSPVAETPEKIQKYMDAIPDLMEMYTLREPDDIERILNRWLQGDAQADNSSVGESRGDSGNKTDELDDLVNTINASPSKEVDEVKDEKPKKSKKAKSTGDNLDAAFEELMDGE